MKTIRYQLKSLNTFMSIPPYEDIENCSYTECLRLQKQANKRQIDENKNKKFEIKINFNIKINCKAKIYSVKIRYNQPPLL